MTNRIRYCTLALLGLFVFLYSCGDDEGDGGSSMMMLTDDFDRSTLLSDWATQQIIPSFTDYVSQLAALKETTTAFVSDPSDVNLEGLRSSWLEAYKAWQWVSIYDIGKAEEIELRNFTNIYPANTEEIEENIVMGNVNLELPSNFDAQGFPALDYMLFGIANNDAEILTTLSSDEASAYLTQLVERLLSLSTEVLDDWNNGFQTAFIENNGAGATASTDKLVNDFIFYYEKFFRAGKIGIPAGVFSGTPSSISVEAPYSGIYSKELFFEAFDVVESFFSGVSKEGTPISTSLEDYVQYITTTNDMSDIAASITNQWQVARSNAQGLNENFRIQVEDDHIRMLEAYDEIQKAVVLLKVEMLQALNIQVDYIDGDGD